MAVTFDSRRSNLHRRRAALGTDITAGSAPNGIFSGDIWNASLRWQLTVRTGIKVSGGRDPRTYLDAESNYYASRGFAIAHGSLSDSRTDEFLVAPRNDKLRTERLLVAYKPRRVFEVDLSYKFEQRESDQPIFEYRDKLASVDFKLLF